MVNPALMLKISTGMTCGYAALFLLAPQLGYKMFFKGGVLPGTSKIEKGGEEADDMGLQKLRWFGFALTATNIYKMSLTNNLKENQKKALECDAAVWMIAAALHAEPYAKKTQPKEICLQQFFAMPLTALMCVLAAKKL